MMTDRSLRGMAVALSLIGVAAFVALCTLVWGYTVDDAYIWFRYGENLANGYGPTFNRTGPHAEGYTGFLWLWVMAIPHLVGADPVFFAKATSCLLAVGVLCLTFLLAHRLAHFAAPPVQWLAGGVAVLLTGSRHGLATHSVAGMETVLYSFLVVLFFYVSVSFRDEGGRTRTRLLPLLGLLVALGRPEGVLVGVATLGVLFLQSGRELRLRLARTTLLAFVLPGAIYFGWRLWYYEVLFPLPFYISSLSGRGGKPGMEEFLLFVQGLGPHVGILLLLGVQRTFRRSSAAAVAAIAVALFFIYPTHRATYFNRYFFPIVPMIYALAGCGVAAAVELVRASRKSASAGSRTAFACAIAIVGVVLWMQLPQVRPSGIRHAAATLNYYSQLIEKRHVRLGRHLAQISSDFDRELVLAIEDAGAVPYYSKWHTIDFFGLNDPHIAVTGEHDPEYVLSQSPDLVVILSWGGESFAPLRDWAGELYDAALESGMEVIRIYGPRTYSLVVLGDPDSVIARRLRAVK